MARANRHTMPGHIWHITHRCHKQEFLLKFIRDRERWCYWLFQAKKRYGLCVLSYIVTSNHIHLLVMDTIFRVRVKTLLYHPGVFTLTLNILAGGWPGALVAQEKLRHKTRKQPFRFIFWVTVLMNCGAFIWFFTPAGSAMLESFIGKNETSIRWSDVE